MDAGTRAIIANISSGKIMKIRWNACYASSHVLKKVRNIFNFYLISLCVWWIRIHRIDKQQLVSQWSDR